MHGAWRESRLNCEDDRIKFYSQLCQVSSGFQRDKAKVRNGRPIDTTTGVQNTATGGSALSDNSTGSFNTALGVGAGSGVTTASCVICIGLTSQVQMWTIAALWGTSMG